jgi:hypothetical protein
MLPVLLFPRVKTLVASTKSAAKRRTAKWIPGAVGDAGISKAQADQFTDGLLKIAARIEGLPPDLARTHDHYLHGLPRKRIRSLPIRFFIAALKAP